jgi:alpha-galactosidase
MVDSLKSVLVAAIIAASGAIRISDVSALDNGLALTPPMGWNSWNCFAQNINENQIKEIADALVSTGMRDAGYVFLNLDDNWMATSRDANGNLRPDPTRFPGGMKALGDYIHSKGLKFGIYGDRGTRTCHHLYGKDDNGRSFGDTKSGSNGREAQDAKTFASWGVDYLKYDNCESNAATMKQDYEKMRDALSSCGRDIVYSICAWEFQPWMPNTGNLWRTTTDILNIWKKTTQWSWGIIDIVDLNEQRAPYAKPGAWNDPDMLQIGNYGNGSPNDIEYRSHMTLWCIMAAPLIAGNDIRKMNQATKDILMNPEVIAVNQDSAGIQGTKIKSANGLDVWCKPLGSKDGDTKAVALFNRNDNTRDITVTFSDVGLSGTVHVRDLWEKADKGSFTGKYTMSVPAHGTGMLKLGPPPVMTSRRIPGVSSGMPDFSIGCLQGSIVVSPVDKSRRYHVSVHLPDGRLIARKSVADGPVSISVRHEGVHIVSVDGDGYAEKKTVPVWR